MSVAAEVGVVASAALAVCGVIGLAVRFVLVPYLRDHLVVPVQETHRAVAAHADSRDERPPTPTLLDRLDDLADKVDHLANSTAAVQAVANASARSAAAANRRLDRHLSWSDEEMMRVWREVAKNTDARHRAEEQRGEQR